MNVIQIFDNRERLGEYLATRQLECGYTCLRVDGAKCGGVLASAIFCQMDGHHFVGKALEIKRYADPVRGGRTKIGIEFHGLTPTCANAT